MDVTERKQTGGAANGPETRRRMTGKQTDPSGMKVGRKKGVRPTDAEQIDESRRRGASAAREEMGERAEEHRSGTRRRSDVRDARQGMIAQFAPIVDSVKMCGVVVGVGTGRSKARRVIPETRVEGMHGGGNGEEQRGRDGRTQEGAKQNKRIEYEAWTQGERVGVQEAASVDERTNDTERNRDTEFDKCNCISTLFII